MLSVFCGLRGGWALWANRPIQSLSPFFFLFFFKGGGEKGMYWCVTVCLVPGLCMYHLKTIQFCVGSMCLVSNQAGIAVIWTLDRWGLWRLARVPNVDKLNSEHMEECGGICGKAAFLVVFLLSGNSFFCSFQLGGVMLEDTCFFLLYFCIWVYMCVCVFVSSFIYRAHIVRKVVKFCAQYITHCVCSFKYAKKQFAQGTLLVWHTREIFAWQDVARCDLLLLLLLLLFWC